MATAAKTRRGGKKNPVVLTRDEVIAKVLAMGGEVEKVRYEKIETLEKTHGKGDVLHRWDIGKNLSDSYKEHNEEAITVYSTGLQRSAQLLRLSIRFFEFYKPQRLQKMLADAANKGHELNWAHFRQLMRDGLTDEQRTDLATRIVAGRWGYRELKDVITAMLAGKKPKGGRRPGKKMTYKTYNRAMSAIRMRSQAWLTLEEGWIDQVNILVGQVSEDEKLTPEFLTFTTGVVEQLKKVISRAQCDVDAAEAIVAEVRKAMGNPKLVEEVVPEPAQPKATAKPRVKPRVKKKRIRLAKHPRMVDGKFV